MQFQVAVLFIILGFTSSSGVADTDGDTNINEINDVDSISSRIFGGTTTARDQYPFVARLLIVYTTGSRTVCSGVVLTTKIIVTVAHCLLQPGGEVASLVTASLPRGGMYVFGEGDIRFNPDFNGIYSADIAVLKKVTTSATFMTNFGTVPSIPVQSGNPVVLFTPAITVGWGRTPGNSGYSQRLQFANVFLSDPTDCNNEYADIAGSMIPNELICTYTNIAGICAGDWGGPLLTTGANNLQVLQGLNMFRRGDDCTNSNPSSAYYNVALAGDWLRTEIA